MHEIGRDVLFGLRGFRKQPGFAILTLALGIGSATTIFSVIQNLLLDPFPYTDAQRVVTIQIRNTANPRPGGRMYFQTAEYLDYQEQNHVFEDVIGGAGDDVLYDTGAGMEQFMGGFVTPNTFRFLGVPALIGRGILPEDANPGAPPVFVMDYRLWTKRFHQDPSILGKTFVLNGTPTTLVGVMPKRFTKLGADVWMARSISLADPQFKNAFWRFQAKLKPGVTLQQAQADIDIIARRLANIYPNNYPKNFSVQIISWVDSLVGEFRTTLYTIAAAVGLLLLIACGNVANMLLARATARQKEMAIRSSLGAGRGRLVRQMLIESLLLALFGAALGCLFSYAGIKGLVNLVPENVIPQEAQIRLNPPVLLFSLGVAILTALLFGLAPALQTSPGNLAEPLKESGRGSSGGFRRGRLRNALVVAEVAMSLVLLSGAGLLIRSFIRLQTVDLGFNPSHLLISRLPFPRGQYKTAAEKQRFYQQLLTRLDSVPGVVLAAETISPPPEGGIRGEIDIPGKTHSERWDAVGQLCSEGYFGVLGLKLERGRLLSDVEVNAARKVAVVNQALVKKYFGDEDPLGRMVRMKVLETLPESPVKDALFEIVGVVSDAKNQGIKDPPVPEFFVPYTVTGIGDRGILVRTSIDPAAMIDPVRHAIWSVDRNIAMTFTLTDEQYLERFSYAEPRFGMVLLSVFAGVGLVLVGVGVFSVIAYTVSRQTQEIGIRIALGASRANVMAMVVRMGMRLLAIGVALGLLASFAITRVIAAQLWGVSPHDPLTLAGVVAVVVAAGLAACYFPARRATRVDPLVALRYE